MPNTTQLTTASQSRDIQLSDDVQERLRADAEAAQADNTRRSYDGQVRKWESWCADRGVEAWPADPNHVWVWLSERARGPRGLWADWCQARGMDLWPAHRFWEWLSEPSNDKLRTEWEAWARDSNEASPPSSPDVAQLWLMLPRNSGQRNSTLSGALSAIKYHSLQNSLPFDGSHRALKVGFKGTRQRNAGTYTKGQKAALTPDILREVLDYMSGDPLDRRDAAMLAMLYVFALRRSELVGIDFGKLGNGNAVLKVDGERAVLTILRSKTSQENEVTLTVRRDRNLRAFAAIERWVKIADIEPGTPLMRSLTPRKTVSHARFSGDGVLKAVKAVMRRYYERNGSDREDAVRLASEFGGHSGRIGLVVASKHAGVADTTIQKRTRHKTSAMIALYGEQADQERDAVDLNEEVGL